MPSISKESWSAFNAETAKIYLNGYGHPSEQSKIFMSDVLDALYGTKEFRLADFGCGNGHLCDFFLGRGLNLRYVGYDFSRPLLSAAREKKHKGLDRVEFHEADIQDPLMQASPADIVLFSHVFEWLESPGGALAAARRLAPRIMIHFAEPPTDRYDLAELRMTDVGPDEPKIPYLRRCLSTDFYNLMLATAGCVSYDVHQVDGDKDQVHVLNF